MKDVQNEIKGIRVTNYLDDFIVISETFDQHVNDLREVFRVFRKWGLTLKLKKCQFVRESLTYLGHTITRQEVKSSEVKSEAIRNFGVPRTFVQSSISNRFL